MFDKFFEDELEYGFAINQRGAPERVCVAKWEVRIDLIDEWDGAANYEVQMGQNLKCSCIWTPCK